MSAAQPEGIGAVLRGHEPGQVERVARVLAESGVRFIEITCTVPDVMGVIERLSGLENATVGCGTVIRVTVARKADVPCVLGGLSPTEVLRAWEAGAAQVKVFPVGRVGGPAYLRDLAGPYPTLRMMPSGGIGLDDVSAYKLPCVASIALGSELAPAAAIASGDWDEIKRRAARALAAWAPST